MFGARVGKENGMGAIAKASVRLGYAADAAGNGIVYARVGNRNPRILRAKFRAPASDDDRRNVGFAAVRAIAPALRKQHLTDVELQVDDAGLIADLTQRRELPATLLLPYVRARCALNSFKACELAESTGPNDLAARALAEVSMRIAA